MLYASRRRTIVVRSTVVSRIYGEGQGLVVESLAALREYNDFFLFESGGR